MASRIGPGWYQRVSPGSAFCTAPRRPAHSRAPRRYRHHVQQHRIARAGAGLRPRAGLPHSLPHQQGLIWRPQGAHRHPPRPAQGRSGRDRALRGEPEDHREVALRAHLGDRRRLPLRLLGARLSAGLPADRRRARPALGGLLPLHPPARRAPGRIRELRRGGGGQHRLAHLLRHLGAGGPGRPHQGGHQEQRQEGGVVAEALRAAAGQRPGALLQGDRGGPDRDGPAREVRPPLPRRLAGDHGADRERPHPAAHHQARRQAERRLQRRRRPDLRHRLQPLLRRRARDRGQALGQDQGRGLPRRPRRHRPGGGAQGRRRGPGREDRRPATPSSPAPAAATARTSPPARSRSAGSAARRTSSPWIWSTSWPSWPP